MAEKRRAKRLPKRLRVRFGEASSPDFPHLGMTHDVSSTGLFVVATHSPKPGSRVRLEVMLPGERPLYIEGVVARQAIVPPELRQLMRAGFGIRYLNGAELMAEMMPAATGQRKPGDPFWITVPTVEAWRALLESELKRGGVFVWTQQPVATSSVVTVTFELAFLAQQLAHQAKVVHTMVGADGRNGVALMFTDAPAAIAAFTAAAAGGG